MGRLCARWRLWRWRGPWDDEARVLSLRVRVGRLLDDPQEITHALCVTSAADAEWDQRQVSRVEAAAGPVLMPVRPYKRAPRWWHRR